MVRGQRQPIVDVNDVGFKAYVDSHPVCDLGSLSKMVLVSFVHADIGRKNHSFECCEVGLCAHPFQEIVVIAVSMDLQYGRNRERTQDANTWMD